MVLKKSGRHIISSLSALLCLYGCSRNAPEVHIHKDSGKTVNLTVEVVRTPDQRNLGLMYRKSLPRGKGMLFVFDDDEVLTFTMKNTFIPLDIIFIDRTKQIVGWVENAKPLSKGPYKIDKPSRFVLEANAYFCKNNAIEVGDRVSFKYLTTL